MIRVAVIGVGSMGKNHVRVYTEMPEVELVAVADANREAAEPVARRYRVPLYTDICEMLDKEKPDAVSIVVPTIEHFRVAKMVLEAGIHVLVEKPIAATLEDAEKLIQTADRLNRVLMVGHIERFNPAIIELKRRLEAGELGQIFQIYARRLGPFPTRISDVGVVMDLAPHDLDIMRYLTGSEVINIYARTKHRLSSNQDDLFVGIISFEDDILGLLEINWLTPTKIRELYVTGMYGMFRVNYLTQDLYFYENAEKNGSNWPALSLLRGVSEGEVKQFAIRKKEPLRGELEAFIACVQGNRAQQVNGKDARMALGLAMGLIESATTGQVKNLEVEL
ncbi:MAG TPA: Gfo/Idh/MocA family oxidoreductase [Anaerolineales bacterium]|nr:Gfo/Idh/MocA family oxidoreductase [Anaerolineales bacterium]